MATIVTRAGKGSPLTNTEVDANFTNLNTDKAELSGAAFTGAITTNSTVDGRDVATDGTKLDTVETNADVTDATNVTAAGALMDSELTAIASVKALDQGVATTDSPTFAAATVTGEIIANGGIALGDNDKATFGAGDDLQIYHDGSNSYIDEVGTGNLKIKSNGSFIDIQSNSTRINNAANNEIMATFVANGGVTLYHDNAQKIATNSLGIDVTGTATMDGLTVDGNAIVNTGAGALSIDSFGGGSVQVSSNGAYKHISTLSSGYHLFEVNSKSVAKFNNNGDISFYEDTGSTPKLFWDASAESLGIGSTPNQILTLDKASGDVFTRFDKGGAIKGLIGIADSTASGSSGSVQGDMIVRGQTNLLLDTAGTTRVKVDASGNVGIGTSTMNGGFNLGNFRGTASAPSFSGTSGDGFVFDYYNDGNPYARHGSIAVIGAGTATADMSFWTDSGSAVTERMRIDSSGNVLVGTTSEGSWTTTAGFIARSNGVTTATVASDAVLHLNRKTSDGDIAVFRKDGTTVGSIGTTGANTVIGTGTVGLRFYDGGNAVIPHTAAGGSSNGLVDLGQAGYNAFKDLHLSGTATIGTNGSEYANNYIRFKSGGAAFIDHLTVGQAINFRISTSSGLDTTPLILSPNTTIFNEAGLDKDFRVESDSKTHMLFVDGGNNRVGVMNSAPATSLHIGQSSGQQQIRIESDGGGASIKGTDTVNNASFGYTVGHLTGTNRYELNIGDVSIFNMLKTGVVFNEGSADMDFRVESDTNTHALFVDGQTGKVSLVGAAGSAGAPCLAITMSNSDAFNHATEFLNPNLTTNEVILSLIGFAASTKNSGYMGYKYSGSGSSNNNLLTFGHYGADHLMTINGAGTLMVGGTSLGDSESCGIEGHGSITVSRTSGTGRYMISFDNGNTNVGRITSSASATQYNTSSDQRLKENIADADDSGSKVDAIQVRKFDWKVDGTHQDYGMVAQELQAVAPEAVSVPEDEDEMMGVDYSKLVPMLIKEIQSLRQRVASLEE